MSDDETEIIVNQKGIGDNIDEEDSQGSSADIRAAHSSSSIQTTTDPSSGSSDTSGVASSSRSRRARLIIEWRLVVAILKTMRRQFNH